MSWVLDLVENLPEFMTYVIPGFLFLAVYRYILFQDEHAADQTSHTLLNSVAISFVLKTVYDGIVSLLFETISERSGSWYLTGILAFSIFAGYFLARAVSLPRTKQWLDRIGVSRTIHSNIWDDILEAGIWLRIWLKGSDKSYYGQVKFIENYGREPLVVLEYYQFLGNNAEVLFDNTDDAKRTVLLNLSQFERVEIVAES